MRLVTSWPASQQSPLQEPVLQAGGVCPLPSTCLFSTHLILIELLLHSRRLEHRAVNMRIKSLLLCGGGWPSDHTNKK